MTIQRLANTAVVLTVLAASTLTPASASAGSLLSGYGGPGQGNQEILGAGLVNGPSGGGGSGGLSASPAPAAGTAVVVASANGTGAQGAGAGRGAAGTHAAHHAARPSRARAVTRGGAAGAVTAARARSAASAPTSVAGDTLGLSGSDVFDAVLVLAALALIGFATRRMTRRPGVGTRAG